jgi:D-alanine-D-alanine ligase
MMILNIVVLAGGYSPERDVSLSSGAMITNALMDKGHNVCLVDSYLGLADSEEVRFKSIIDGGSYYHQIGENAPDIKKITDVSQKRGFIGNRVIEICRLADVVFLALHGGAGENGQIQAVLDAFGIPYIGSGYAGSSKALDKHVAKLIMRESGIPTPDWRLYTKENVAEAFFLPVVVKPCNGGSSIGVIMVENQNQWEEALCKAFEYEEQIIAEVKITGREFSIGVLGGKTLPIIEIIPKSGFYDYENKYQPDKTEEICPAKIINEKADEMNQLALKVHQALGLGYYSRIDFLMEENGNLYCLEANTLPGMTPFSLLPQEALAAGISYADLCDDIANHWKGVL